MKVLNTPRALSPKVQRVMDLMLTHADPAGYIEWDKLPDGWDDKMPSRRYATETAERLRRTGRFKLAQEQMSRPAINVTPPERDEQAGAPSIKSQRKELVMKIAGNPDYIGSNNKILWNKAFAEHPDWKAALVTNTGSLQRAFQLAYELRKSGRLPAHRADIIPTTTPQVEGEFESLVKQLGNEYFDHASGRVMWKSAFSANPELAKKLRWYDGSKYKQRVYYAYDRATGRAVKRAKVSRRKAKAHTNGAGSTMTPETLARETVAAEVERIMAQLCFCPRCGNDLRPHHMAATMNGKLTTSRGHALTASDNKL